MGVLSLVFIIIVVIYIYKQVTEGNSFRDNSKRIQVGMSKSQVISIMGEPSFRKNHQNGSYELIYKRSEWKGFWRGGTKTRRMELVFSSDNILISIGKNQNCDMSGW
ncbi:MAG: outer membrane protein assembly factor BamE [Clostridia bacterium]|nr:outer membrane protein assembly factor BamE [Clostridia bacterium]